MLFLNGDSSSLNERQKLLDAIPVDMTVSADNWSPDVYQTTLAAPFEVTGPATYKKGNSSTLRFEPAPPNTCWWIKRTDQPEQLPINVFTGNVWTAKRNIVLRSGSPHNYLRMSEHIIAHRLGMNLDNVIVSTPTGDPPLFDVGSMPIVEAIQQVGIVRLATAPLRYRTVKQPVAFLGPHDSFLLFLPDENASKKLTVDVAIDFPTVIGKQRIVFDLTPEAFAYGAHARTNCSRSEMLLAKTVGMLFADTRNLGYTKQNILVAGKTKYVTKPRPELIHDGKVLEAVWHRACLDFIAALSLLDVGRLCGRVVSYKAGHTLDCRFMNLLYINDLLTDV